MLDLKYCENTAHKTSKLSTFEVCIGWAECYEKIIEFKDVDALQYIDDQLLFLGPLGDVIGGIMIKDLVYFRAK